MSAPPRASRYDSLSAALDVHVRGSVEERLVWVRGHWVGDETLPARQGHDVTGIVR